MKRLLVAAVLVLFAGGYYFRSFFFKTAPDRSLYQYTLQSSGNLDELYRFASEVEAQMRQLPVFQGVGSDLEIKSAPAIVNRQKTAAQDELLMVTISFKLAPGVSLGEAIARIADAERRLVFPATITSAVQAR